MTFLYIKDILFILDYTIRKQSIRLYVLYVVFIYDESKET